MIKRLIILALLAYGGWWVYTHWLPQHQFKYLSGHVESGVDGVLSQAGIDDTHVLAQTRIERQRFGMSWVETDRRFQLSSEKDLDALLPRLKSVARQNSCTFTRYVEGSGHIRIKIGQPWAVYQNMLFVVTTASSQETVLPKVPSLPHRPVVAFVIDDVAYDMEPMDHFAELKIPLTFAILPRDRHTRELAEKAVHLGFPVILHLPMEPLDLAHNDPGGAGLYLRMTPEQLHEQFEKDVASVPHIQGINNHMGSAFTSNEEKMSIVMPWVKEKHLFFLDSHTAPHSVVSRVAKQVGVPCLINQTFLDNQDTVPAIEHQLDIVLQLALKTKRTIAIGHYRRKCLVEAFSHKIPEFRAKGVSIVFLPSLYPKP